MLLEICGKALEEGNSRRSSFQSVDKSWSKCNLTCRQELCYDLLGGEEDSVDRVLDGGRRASKATSDQP